MQGREIVLCILLPEKPYNFDDHYAEVTSAPRAGLVEMMLELIQLKNLNPVGVICHYTYCLPS